MSYFPWLVEEMFKVQHLLVREALAPIGTKSEIYLQNEHMKLTYAALDHVGQYNVL